MVWVKIDDALPRHPKIVGLPKTSRWVFIEALCYWDTNLTDGFIPQAAAYTMGLRRELRPLVEAGLWTDVPGGFQIVSYLEFQPSRAEVEAKREAISTVRSEAGKKGAQARWGDGKDSKGDSKGGYLPRKNLVSAS